jgi:PBSX family phage terminase large subunit
MKLLPKQAWSYHRSNARLNLWSGSVRSGKTVASIYRPIQLIPQADPKGKIFLIGKTISALKRNIIEPMEDYLGDQIYYYSGKLEIHLWGRVIHVIGANDSRAEGKIRGSTVSLAYIDEVTLIDYDFFMMLDSRMSPAGSVLLGTTNPDSPNHWLKKNYIDRRSDLDFKLFKFCISDNTTLDEKYVDTLKKNFIGLWYKRFILGIWCSAMGAIYDFFDEDEHTFLTKKLPNVDIYNIGIDYATGNPTSYILGGSSFDLTKKPHTYIIDEYYWDSKKEQRQKTDAEYSYDLLFFCSKYTSTYDQIIQNKYGLDKLFDTKNKRVDDKPLINIVIDPSAANFKLQLKKDGFIGIKSADNDVINGIKFTSGQISQRYVIINHNCRHLINEIFGYCWDSKKQENGIDAPIKKDDHAVDATRYLLYTLFGRVLNG